MGGKQLNIVMYPWLAMGHIIPYYQLGLKLSERGHNVTLVLPNKAKLKLPSSNLHPLLNFHTITIPHIHPLPLDTQLNSEIPFHLETHLATALDLTRPEFESILVSLQPTLVFYDLAYWVPEAVTTSGSCTKCVTYLPTFPVAIALAISEMDTCVSRIPLSYPSSSKEVREPSTIPFDYHMPYGEGVTFHQRITAMIENCQAIGIKSCREIEGKYCDFISSHYNKPVLLSGVVSTEPNENVKLEVCWAEWLNRFSPATVVFCALGSQVVLDVAQFQELLLGFEMTKLPFLVALKPPTGFTTVEEAFPKGFAERVGERGVVTGEWVPQPQIVSHPSIGCFVNHCGSGSIWDALLCKNQIVLMPQLPDQESFANLLAQELKVAVQVERGEDGSWVAKESLCKAINSVMDENNDIGNLVKTNHEIYRQKLAKPGLMSDYIDNFIKDLQALVG